MKVSSRLKNINKLSLAISLIISIIAWFYVVYNVNPTMSRKFRNIPVTVIGEDTLRENGLAVASIDVEYVDITLRAKRSILDSVDESSIAISADVSEAGKGDNRLALEVTAPPGTVMLKQSKRHANISIETLKTKEVNIKTSLTGKLAGDEEVDITDLVEKSVEISGAKSIVDSADYADASIDVDRLNEKNKTISVPLTVKNHSGKALKYLKLKPSKVNLKAVKYTKKKVKLNLKVNNPENNFTERTYSAPNEIYIKGNKKALMNISGIDTKLIDISDVQTTKDIALEYNLPQGISISNESKNVVLHVECTPLKEKKFTVDAESIKLENLDNGLNATGSGKVDVTVYGKSDEISKIEKSDIVLSIDLSGYSAGSYSIRPAISSIGQARRSELSGEITITIN